jgi:hypothetical protein
MHWHLGPKTIGRGVSRCPRMFYMGGKQLISQIIISRIVRHLCHDWNIWAPFLFFFSERYVLARFRALNIFLISKGIHIYPKNPIPLSVEQRPRICKTSSSHPFEIQLSRNMISPLPHLFSLESHFDVRKWFVFVGNKLVRLFTGNIFRKQPKCRARQPSFGSLLDVYVAMLIKQAVFKMSGFYKYSANRTACWNKFVATKIRLGASQAQPHMVELINVERMWYPPFIWPGLISTQIRNILHFHIMNKASWFRQSCSWPRVPFKYFRGLN